MNVMKDKHHMHILIGILLLLLFIVIIGLVAGAAGKSPEDKCIKPGCHNERIPDSNFCSIHDTNTGSIPDISGNSPQTYSPRTGDGSTPGTTDNRSSTSAYSGGGSGQKPLGSTTKPSTRTYNTLNNDPADYDDPEDYADDAWGDDFDDWGDAYDYWEDY